MSHQSELIAQDIEAYLNQHEQKELLRFLTCGSVDDGKSTLIGRLLHDSKMIYEDQLAAVKSASSKHGTTEGEVDLALLVDGLQAEREQGITIDVAYRYFSTAKRKFIIADTPGHEQYTRNMATGASTCDLAVILIDARYGAQTQTRRHTYIASLLGIKHIVVAINKMDLVSFDEEIFKKIRNDYLEFVENLNISSDLYFIPISALNGDNIVEPSKKSPWYSGSTLMEILETVEISADKNRQDFRFPVQYVNRPNLDFRGFCGTVASGVVNVGDEVRVLPSGKTSKIKRVVNHDGDMPCGFVDQAITLILEDEIDVSRGDMIVKADEMLQPTNHLRAHIVWMSESVLEQQKPFFFKFSSRLTSGHIKNIIHRVDVNTQEHLPTDTIDLNDIALVHVALNQPVVIDNYDRNRATGAFIIIDRLTNVTVGAGMVVDALDSVAQSVDTEAFEADLTKLIKHHFTDIGSDQEVAALVKKFTRYL
ncbi:sulfate adenylyltransferase subunit CysN [Candidatus Endobugula sertula]|uniref:Sulfate adenylyltransferase subunit 1 n=1 Tax=Candidatus Endobugula sertula TaxID=62101 RepID=A0A1D2QR79_9GAMM|nr:sulfate adenylyltransferase subunit CysN [Candidatus Endobugula sertula]